MSLMSEVLAAWREAERRTTGCPPGTPEHAAATARVRELRTFYHFLATTREGHHDESVHAIFAALMGPHPDADEPGSA